MDTEARKIILQKKASISPAGLGYLLLTHSVDLCNKYFSELYAFKKYISNSLCIFNNPLFPTVLSIEDGPALQEVERVLKGCQKIIFCLKSSMFCEK